MDIKTVSPELRDRVAQCANDRLTVRERNHLSQYGDAEISNFGYRIARFLLCEFDADDAHALSNIYHCAYHLPLIEDNRADFPSFGLAALEFVSSLLRVGIPDDVQIQAIDLYARLCRHALDHREVPIDGSHGFRELLARDIGVAVSVYRVATYVDPQNSGELLSQVLRKLSAAKTPDDINFDISIWLNTRTSHGLANLIGLLLDVRLMRGDWAQREDLVGFVNTTLSAFPNVNKSGIRSHASRIALVGEIADAIEQELKEVTLDEHTLVFTLPAWGPEFVERSFALGISQLAESWEISGNRLWTKAVVVLISGSGDRDTVQRLNRHHQFPVGFQVVSVILEQKIFSLTKNYLMPTFTMGGFIACRNQGVSIFPTGADAFFGKNIFDRMEHLIIDRGFKIILADGNAFSEDIMDTEKSPHALRDESVWHRYIGDRINKLKLNFDDRLHNQTQPSKMFCYKSFSAFYLQTPTLTLVTGPILRALHLPHWYTLDGWSHELVWHFGIVEDGECFVTRKSDFPHGCIDPDQDSQFIDDHHQVLLSEFGSKTDFFQNFRATRLAHKFTPLVCRAARIAVIIGDPELTDLGRWGLDHAIYDLAMELTETEVSERPYWGVSYADAVTCARSLAMDATHDSVTRNDISEAL